jgi:L-threonylcarbamoyladenylate synthase
MVVSALYDMADPETRSIGLTAAARACRRGRLIVLPVDSAYGIGTEAFSIPGVTRLLEAKGRGRGAPVPVLVGRIDAIHGLLSVGPAADALATAFWPGSLTLVGRAQPSLAWDLGASSADAPVAIRMPLHPVAIALLREVGPMAITGVTSADGTPARSAQECTETLGAHASVVLDGGVLPPAPPSTVVDVTGPAPVLLRAGAVSVQDLAAVCPDLVVTAAVD